MVQRFISMASKPDRRRLTNGENDSLESWALNSNRILFTHFGGSSSYIASITVTGSGKNRLTPRDGYEEDTQWAPDDSRIVFMDRGPTNWLHLMKPSGKDKKRLTRIGNDPWAYPTWSPNSKQIAFRRDAKEQGQNSKSWDIWIMRRNGTHKKMITDNDRDNYAVYGLDW